MFLQFDQFVFPGAESDLLGMLHRVDAVTGCNPLFERLGAVSLRVLVVEAVVLRGLEVLLRRAAQTAVGRVAFDDRAADLPDKRGDRLRCFVP